MDNKKIIPFYSKKEEFLNASTHALGIIFGILSCGLLFIKFYNNISHLFASLVYSLTLITLYSVSTLYHSITNSKIKNIFRKLDHCAIFLLIAGTYTPICFIYIKNTFSLFVLSCIWFFAILGVVLNSINVNKFAKFSLICYTVMGWAAIALYQPLIQNFSKQQILSLFIGGAFYTIGIIFYILGKKFKYMHFIWHLFVLAGSVSHFLIFI